MGNFHIGDSVVAIRDGMWGDIPKGEEGTVVAFHCKHVGINWGREVPGGHNCGLPEYRSLWCCTWACEDDIQRVTTEDDEVTPCVLDVV